MSTEFSAHFDGRFIVPDEPISLPVGQKLRLRVDAVAEGAGPFANLVEFAVDLPDSPGDLSSQHDHYLYGTPKR
jgi:hypothetical protein